MRGGPTVQLQGVWAGYRRGLHRVEALRDVDWVAHPGEVTALVGPNGAGKTTTFRLLLGVLRAREGSVGVGGEPPAAYRVARGLGFLPEARVHLPGWTVGDLLRAGGSAGTDRGSLSPLEPCIAALGPRRLDDLSRGEARTALLAYALAGGPELVLLDEPWSALDAGARAGLAGALHDLRDRGSTVVVSSHELLEVARVADRVVVLASGRVARVAETAGLGPDALERAVREASP